MVDRMIFNAVAQYFDVKVGDIVGRSRKTQYTIPRHMVMLLLYRYTPYTLKEIGARLDNRDHATILSAVDRMESDMAVTPYLSLYYKEIVEILSKMGQVAPEELENLKKKSANTRRHWRGSNSK
jgi:chromosomal replication initiator protein